MAFLLICCLAASTSLAGEGPTAAAAAEPSTLSQPRAHPHPFPSLFSRIELRHRLPGAGAYASYAATLTVLQFLQATLFAQVRAMCGGAKREGQADLALPCNLSPVSDCIILLPQEQGWRLLMNRCSRVLNA